MDMDNNSTEDHMYGIWDAILNWTFPATSGYITRPQDRHGQFGGGGLGFSDFHTFQYNEATGQRSFILITQCKRYELRTRPAEWQAATEQLRDYLNLQHQTQPTHDVYGIVAIGDRVRFFKYNYQQKNVTAWRPPAGGLLPLSNTVGKRHWYDLVAEAPRVQRALEYILSHH